MIKRKKGFSLIELLVVVLIIGIVAGIAIPHYRKTALKSKVTAIRQIVAAIKNAEENFGLMVKKYT